jgi:hypothetical protein
MRVRYIVICGLSGSYPHYLINGRISEKKKMLWNETCVSVFSTTLVWNISYSEEKWTRYDKKNCIGLHVKCPIFLSDFSECCIFSDRFSKKTQIPNLMQICPKGAELFRADRRRDITKLMVAFRNFANSPKKFVGLLTFNIEKFCMVLQYSEVCNGVWWNVKEVNT